MKNCLICDKHLEKSISPIYEGEHAFIFHYHTNQEMPQVFQGHCFVEPKKHVTHYGELSKEEAAEMGELIRLTSLALVELYSAEHIYTFNIGHMVSHLHVHIMPRYAGTPEQYRGEQRIYEWSGAKLLDSEDVKKVNSELKSHITALIAREK